jgi:phosphoribosylformylglycinamidine synthase
MRAAVVVFPGSNADAEMIRSLRDVVGIPTEVAWHKHTALPAGVDLVVLPGGFSYGDYLRSGAIAKASPILADVRRHVERGGLVLGVCNGFQILVECGLLPGALTRNAQRRFECKEVFLGVRAEGAFTSGLAGRTLRLPIAHGEGRYVMPAGGLADDAIALVYTDASGKASPSANPNGSDRDIAGVYGGPARNVFGLMPHPERMSEPTHGGTDGRLLFESARAWLAGKGGERGSTARPTRSAA